MSRSVSPPWVGPPYRWVGPPYRSGSLPYRGMVLTLVGLLLLVPSQVRAAPGPTLTPEPTAVGGPTYRAPGGEVETPVVDVQAPMVDVFLVSGDVDGDSTEAESADRVEVTIGADVLFAFGKAELTPAASQRLAQAAGRIRSQARGTVLVDGHTDSIGSPAANQRLSRRRAEAVRDALAALLVDTPVTFRVTGHGERKPVVPNSTPEGKDDPAGRAKNRRVEIRFDK
ncbi:OmpA family protein [Plantactinospora sp. B6F1]|uniref:OmpA family protein n=1 Tax=Plantactinospora sp. B6F1 TaxID=3158971 RepID=UPI0032D910C9